MKISNSNTEGDIIYVLVNNMGGITSMIGNLAKYSGSNSLNQSIIFLDIKGNNKSLFNGCLVEGIPQTTIKFDKNKNWYSQFGELYKNISKGPGILVTNDEFDLIMLRAFNIDKNIIQIVHDEYNLQLSVRFNFVIDRFIAHSRFIFAKLNELIPERSRDIVFIPYGIPILEKTRAPNLNRPLHLIFLGRLTSTKGVFDLYPISQILKRNGITVNWTIIGSGPDEFEIKKQWEGIDNIKFETPANYEDLTNFLAQGDVFVFPTKFEGFPVALLEAMSLGVVPVVTDLEGGIREIMNDSLGFKCEIDDNEGFANAIMTLHHQRDMLEEMSQSCKKIIGLHFDAKIQSPKYHSYFKSVLAEKAEPIHRKIYQKIGSRLDQRWLPNFITSAIRKLLY